MDLDSYTIDVTREATPLVSKPLRVRRPGREMTDKELVLSLCGRLGLCRIEESDSLACWPHGYAEAVSDTGSCIEIGAGAGYGGFFVQFDFDAAGKVLGHGVWE